MSKGERFKTGIVILAIFALLLVISLTGDNAITGAHSRLGEDDSINGNPSDQKLPPLSSITGSAVLDEDDSG